MFPGIAVKRILSFGKIAWQQVAQKGFHALAAPRICSVIQQIQPRTFLQPDTPILEQVAGFKVKGRLRKRCKDCYFVMREERLYVICKTHPRHKQMAMKQRDYKSWILTHATQSKIRPY